MSDAVVVLGAGGTVGAACVEALLRQGATVIATGRHLATLRARFAHIASARLTFAELDLFAEVPWPDAVCASRRFIQCAGPSHCLTDLVISRLISQCAEPGLFIEPGGDTAAIARWRVLLAARGWLGIFGAGIQPGLVGVIIRALSQLFASMQSLEVVTFVGGLQPLTPAGLKDYLQAVNDRTGHPGMELYKNTWRRVGAAPALPDCFPASAQSHPFVDEEAALAANALGLGSLSGFNITDSTDISHLLNEIMVSGSVPETASVRIAGALAGRTPWFCLYAHGRVGNPPMQKICGYLTCGDSYRVTGEVAAWAALNIACGQSSGASWFSAHPQALAIWSHWETNPPENVKIVWQHQSHRTACEEGEL